MQGLGNNSLLLMERAMNGLWTRQTAIYDNIVNAETPNYKAKYVTFEDTLKARLNAASHGSRPNAAVRQTLGRSDVQVHQAQENTRMDDNGVNLTDQNVEMTRTAYQLQYVMDSINHELSLLRTAIRGQ